MGHLKTPVAFRRRGGGGCLRGDESPGRAPGVSHKSAVAEAAKGVALAEGKADASDHDAVRKAQ